MCLACAEQTRLNIRLWEKEIHKQSFRAAAGKKGSYARL